MGCAGDLAGDGVSAAEPTSVEGDRCGTTLRAPAPNAMARRRCEFVDNRLRRSPPDRASAVPYGQAGENAMRLPHLAHRSAAAHTLHRTPQPEQKKFISG